MNDAPTESLRRTLSEEIRRAFADVPMPASETELGAGIDPGWPRTLQTFLGKSWEVVKRKDLLWHQGDPFYEFTDDAVTYYLQSYAQAILNDPQGFGFLIDTLAWQFSPEGEPTADDRCARLTAAQRAALGKVFEAFARSDIANDNVLAAAMLLQREWED